jgi:hypothetical protein
VRPDPSHVFGIYKNIYYVLKKEFGLKHLDWLFVPHCCDAKTFGLALRAQQAGLHARRGTSQHGMWKRGASVRKPTSAMANQPCLQPVAKLDNFSEFP